jgi:hypothetical protein
MSEKDKALNISLMKRYAKLEKAKAALSAAMDRVEAKLEPLREAVTDELIDAGIEKMTVDGRTIFIKHDIWARLLKGKPEAIKALKEAGLEEYIAENFNMNSLSAYVREKINNNESLPKEFDGIIGESHVYKARSVKS